MTIKEIQNKFMNKYKNFIHYLKDKKSLACIAEYKSSERIEGFELSTNAKVSFIDCSSIFDKIS